MPGLRERVLPCLMHVFLMLACAGHKTCERETSEVSDSSTDLGDIDGSVDLFLGRATGTFTLPATWSSGDTTTVEFTLARATGMATLDDGTLVGLVNPFGMNPIEVVCNDQVTVPVDLSVSTDDGALEISGTTNLSAEGGGDAGTEITVLAAILDDGRLVADAEDPAGWAWASFDEEGLSRVQIQLDEEQRLDSVEE